jgi:hypothetical protein
MAEGLGAHVATHRYSTKDEQRFLLIGGLVVVAGIVALAYNRALGFLIIGGAVLFDTLTLAKVLYALVGSGGVFERHEHGLRVVRGGKEQIIPYAKIRAVHRWRSAFDTLERKPGSFAVVSPWRKISGERKAKNLWRYRIESDGAPLTLDRHWTDLTDLIDVVTKHRKDARMESDARALAGDGEAVFGPVTLTSRSVIVRGRELSWEDTRDIVLLQGQLVVRRKPNRQFAVVDAADVPDIDVLLELARSASNAAT